MAKFVAFLCGLIFGLGLVVSQMSNPAKVLNFLDFAGTFDPSLVFVMVGAILATAIGYRLAWRWKSPKFETVFHLPQATRIDARLIGGATLFGIGWGLVGFCPGPALTALSFGGWQTLLFVAAMAAGMILFDQVSKGFLSSSRRREALVGKD
ncbi:MAG: YeeE/YedE family protein [Pseudomonadota bacterium]